MEKLINFVIDQWLLFAIAAFLIFLIARSFVTAKLSGVKDLGTNDAVRMINDNALVLDVRLEKEFATGHIENAVHIPVGALEARIRELEKHKGSPVIVNCQTGNRSMFAAKILRKHGFENVYNLRGGINAWINANMPITTKSGKRKK